MLEYHNCRHSRTVFASCILSLIRFYSLSLTVINLFELLLFVIQKVSTILIEILASCLNQKGAGLPSRSTKTCEVCVEIKQI